ARPRRGRRGGSARGRASAAPAARRLPRQPVRRRLPRSSYGGLVLLPAGELAAGELLECDHVLAELGDERFANRVGKLGLRRGGGVGVVDDLLHDPAQPLWEAIEVAIEGPESRELDQPLHELVAVRLLGGRLLPLAGELLGVEALIDSGEAEG